MDIKQLRALSLLSSVLKHITGKKWYKKDTSQAAWKHNYDMENICKDPLSEKWKKCIRLTANKDIMSVSRLKCAYFHLTNLFKIFKRETKCHAKKR